MCSAQMSPPREWGYFTIISPLFITLLILFVSGLPILEPGMHKRYKNKAEYLTYLQETSILIPLPHFLYRALPAYVKQYLLFDWEMYKTGEMICLFCLLFLLIVGLLSWSFFSSLPLPLFVPSLFLPSLSLRILPFSLSHFVQQASRLPAMFQRQSQRISMRILSATQLTETLRLVYLYIILTRGNELGNAPQFRPPVPQPVARPLASAVSQRAYRT